MNTLYVRCQTKDYILDIVAARAGMRINKINSTCYSVYKAYAEYPCLGINKQTKEWHSKIEDLKKEMKYFS